MFLSRNMLHKNHRIQKSIIKSNYKIYTFTKKNNYGTTTSVVKSTYEDIEIPNQSITELVLSGKDHRTESPALVRVDLNY